MHFDVVGGKIVSLFLYVISLPKLVPPTESKSILKINLIISDK
jgi:hypothetical protein